MAGDRTDFQGRVARMTAKLDVLARENGVRIIGVAFPDGQLPVVHGEGPIGAVVLDATSPHLLAEMSALAGVETRPALRELAGKASGHGVELRRRGELVHSYLAARVGLFGACVLGEPPGVSATGANVWILRESVRDVLERAGGGSRAAFEEAGIDAHAYGEALQGLAATMEADAADACPLVARIVNELAEDATPTLLHTWHRLMRMSGDISGSRREVRARLRAVCEIRGAWDVLLRSTADDVAQMNIVDILVSMGELPLSEAAGAGNDAYDAMVEYAAARTHLRDFCADLSVVERLATELAQATRHLAYLRLSATMSGGAFAHEIAFVVAQHLHVVGRDLVFLQRLLGRDEDALMTAESLLARSLVDWATRTHGISRHTPEVLAAVAPLTGSQASTAVLSLLEVCGVAAEHGPLLYFLGQPDGYAVWLVLQNGQIVSSHIDDPEDVLAPLFVALPYLNGPVSEVARQISGTPADVYVDTDLSPLLTAAYTALIPAEIDAAFESAANSGEERLVIVPDSRLEPVPFSALRTPRGRYLVEERELSTVPSATALDLLASSRRRWPVVQAVRGAEVRPLVLGRAHFDEVVPLSRPDGVAASRPNPLPGAAIEAHQVAALLGVKPLLDDDATAAVLLSSSGATVVHVATHGYYNQAHPLESYLAFADRRLSADDLYRADAGVRSNLIVLSACQTALGGEHPDSTIGLSNAFLIAGAHAVVSSLWNIPDDLTPALMDRFHRLVLAQTPVAAALRTMQREALSAPKTSAPRAWAAFRISGCAT